MKFSEYIPPTSDFGFKNLFGKGEKSKDNLIFLLNEVLKDYPDFDPVVSVEYLNSEHQGDNPDRKSTRFDVYCRTESNKVFIVEMQNQPDPHLNQRLIFYMCQAVTEQDSRVYLEKAWNYNFPPVIVIMFCDFTDPEIDPVEVNHFGFMNLKTHKQFGNHVGLSIVQMPLFPTTKSECKTELDKIVFSMMNMDTILTKKENSFSTQEGDFYDRIEKMSRTAALTREELHAYHQWLKVTNDDRLWREKAREEGLAEGRAEGLAEGRAEGLAKGRTEGRTEGRAEGIAEGKWQMAKKMIDDGMDLDKIALYSQIPIDQLRQRLKDS